MRRVNRSGARKAKRHTRCTPSRLSRPLQSRPETLMNYMIRRFYWQRYNDFDFQSKEPDIRTWKVILEPFSFNHVK